MNLKLLDRFLKELAKTLPGPLTLVLTGGVEARLLGGRRVTQDLDFAVLPAKGVAWQAVEQAIARASEKCGLPVQYSQDISRWSMVDFLDWKEKALPYRRLGKLQVKQLHPLHWSIGKITRSYASDEEDLMAVLKKQKLAWQDLATIWAKALQASPPSSDLANVKKQMLNFFSANGRKVWGHSFHPQDAENLFLSQVKRRRS